MIVCIFERVRWRRPRDDSVAPGQATLYKNCDMSSNEPRWLFETLAGAPTS
jgi:hypothetical protein